MTSHGLEFETDDPDELRRLAKRARRTARFVIRRGKSGRYAETVKDAEQSFLRMAQAYEDRADEIVRQRKGHTSWCQVRVERGHGLRWPGTEARSIPPNGLFGNQRGSIRPAFL